MIEARQAGKGAAFRSAEIEAAVGLEDLARDVGRFVGTEEQHRPGEVGEPGRAFDRLMPIAADLEAT